MNQSPQSTRQARQSRARMIRRRVAAAAVSLFLAAWAVIAVQLVSGHDPALAAHNTSTVGSSASGTSSSGASGSGSALRTSSSGSSGTPTTSGGTSSSGSTASSSGSVTTRQS
jgi:hypothetical protein